MVDRTVHANGRYIIAGAVIGGIALFMNTCYQSSLQDNSNESQEKQNVETTIIHNVENPVKVIVDTVYKEIVKPQIPNPSKPQRKIEPNTIDLDIRIFVNEEMLGSQLYIANEKESIPLGQISEAATRLQSSIIDKKWTKILLKKDGLTWSTAYSKNSKKMNYSFSSNSLVE